MGPAFNHYRCLRVYIPKTHRERITNTATIIPKQIPIPKANLQDHLRRTADDLVHLLHSKPSLLPHHKHSSTRGALLNIAKILQRNSTPTNTPITTPMQINNKQNINDNTSSNSSESSTILPSEGGVPLASSEGVPLQLNTSLPNTTNKNHTPYTEIQHLPPPPRRS